MDVKYKIGFIGAGNMATAIASSVLSTGETLIYLNLICN